MGKAFTEEQDAWLRMNHAPSKIIRQLTEEFNWFWGDSRSVDTMKHHCKRLGLQQERRNFTAEQDAWLRENSRFMDYKETTERFNEMFSTSRTPGTIKVHCNRDLGIGFKNDHLWTGDAIGAEKIRNGYVWVKVSDIPCKHTGKLSADINWRQKSHIVWEQHHGSLPPEGYTIVFLDRNKQNCDIENLYAVSNKVLREMSKKSWWSENPELTLAAIKWCELFYTLKEVGKRD